MARIILKKSELTADGHKLREISIDVESRNIESCKITADKYVREWRQK